MRHGADRWADYEHDGYLVVPDCVDTEILCTLQEKLDPILTDPDSVPGNLRGHLQTERNYLQWRKRDGDPSPDDVGNAVRLVMELPLFDPDFARFIAYEPILDVLEALFGSTEFHFHNYKCINKAPGASTKFVCHRDLAPRYAYQGLYPRSTDPARKRQLQMALA